MQVAEARNHESSFPVGGLDGGSMNGLEIMFDGINLQQVGELLLDEPTSTRRVRRLCLDSYYRSLKDFAFAVIFGGQIVTSVGMPNVEEGTPGESLLDRKYFGGKHTRRAPPSATSFPTWEKLLESNTDRSALESLVRSLGQLDAEGLRFWQLYLRREFHLYFGDDKSLRKPNARPEYVFKGRGNFCRDLELQSHVPDKYRRHVASEIRHQLQYLPGVRDAHDDAIDEFICRNAVAHIGIYRWYSQVGERSLDQSIALRIPHATRQCLPDVERSLWTIKEMTTPGLLEVMITDSRNREELLDKLIDASQDTVYNALREKIAAAWQLLEKFDRKNEMDTLRADIECEIKSLHLSPLGRVAVATGKSDALYKEAIRMLAIRGAGRGSPVPNCLHVFDELVGD